MSKRRSKKQIEETSSAGRTLLALKSVGSDGATIKEIALQVGLSEPSVAAALIKLGRMDLIRAKEMDARLAKFTLSEYGGFAYAGRSSIALRPSGGPIQQERKPRTPRTKEPQPPAAPSLLTLSIHGISLTVEEAREVYSVLHRLFGS